MTFLRIAPAFLVALLVGSGGLTTTIGCKQEPAVSSSPPAKDAEMKKIVMNVFGMT